MIAYYKRAISLISSRFSESLMLLFVRIALGHVFWASGQTKVEGWHITDTTYALFAEEFKLPLLPPDIAAVVTTFAEHLFPILLLFGIWTRLSAFALFIMTMVIQLFVFPDAWWPVHSLWIGLALVLIVRGGGMISLDRLMDKKNDHR